MVPNNNLSVLPFYSSPAKQNAKKWWVYGRVYPLYTPDNVIPPFQIIRPQRRVPGRTLLEPFNVDIGYIIVSGNRVSVDFLGDSDIGRFDIRGYTHLSIENLPPSPTGYSKDAVSLVFRDVDGVPLGTIQVDHYYTDDVIIPDGAVTVMAMTLLFSDPPENAVKIYGRGEQSGGIMPIKSCRLMSENGTFQSNIDMRDLEYKEVGEHDVIINAANRLTTHYGIGRHYIEMTDGVDTWYSDVFTMFDASIESNYLQLRWRNNEDVIMADCAIVYNLPSLQTYENVIYLAADIAKPDYEFEEDVMQREGYTFPIKRVSYKRYRFSFLAPEYLLDVLRFVRMSDHIEIIKDGHIYGKIDSFILSPEWEKNGDVAVVDAEFTTDTVAKKVGQGFIVND